MSTRRALPALLIAVSLAALPALAQASPASTARTDRAELSLTRASGLFNSLWRSLTSLWGLSGSSSTTSSPKVPGDNGGMIDPNGLAGDSGGSIDPNGLAGDNGVLIDPNG